MLLFSYEWLGKRKGRVKNKNIFFFFCDDNDKFDKDDDSADGDDGNDEYNHNEIYIKNTLVYLIKMHW